MRHNSVVEGCHVPPGFHIPSTTSIHNDEELAKIQPVPVEMTAFSEDVARTNVDFVKGYKRLSNEMKRRTICQQRIAMILARIDDGSCVQAPAWAAGWNRELNSEE